MGVADERTPLRQTEGGGPPYMFMINPNKLYRKQIHQFQCLICLSFLLLFMLALSITILQSVEDDIIDNNKDNSSSIDPLLKLSFPIKDKSSDKWNGDISDKSIENALYAAQISLAEKDKFEKDMVGLPPDSSSYKHQRSIKTSLRATYLARTGYMMNVATKKLLKNENTNVGKKSVGKSQALKNSILAEDVCGKDKVKPNCAKMPYRSVDGTCNNLNNPDTWGVALHPFRRALPADYADGVSEPRKASDGSELPSAREVSVVVHRPDYRGDNDFTVMLAVWGQFLDHDITATALSQGKDGTTIQCCGKSSSESHPECFPVAVGPEDPFYKNISCLEFVRSAPAPTCYFGPREQLNQASSYIDGSVIYGNTEELMSSLRSYENGQLRMTVTPDGRTLLPISTDPKDGCNNEIENSKGRYCFSSGDARANENIHLTTLHLIMARHHNYIASQLAAINPDWKDETLFQETRKIVAAQMQHITYNEFLPILLGDTVMEKLELTNSEEGFNEKYDPSIDASASNNFATAAFRFAHTLLPGLMKVMKNISNDEKVELHQLLFDPYKLYEPGYIDSTLKGAMNTPLERMDNYFNKELTEKLFKQPTKAYGLDLVSLNIQRGRDHGLPSYAAWREHCGLSKPSTFDDLKSHLDEDSLTRLSSLYKSVDDIDLYTGALSEFPTEEGILGPTFTCLIADQFKRLKAGDRFWYESNQQPQAFSAAQLNEIRKTSLAGIICNTADIIDGIRYKVMENLSPENQLVSCSKVPQPDYTLWSNSYSIKIKEAETTEGTLIPTTAVFGLHVNKVVLNTDDGISWYGSTPVDIPLSVFSPPSVGPARTLPPTLQWTATAVEITPTTVKISGTYSAVTYTIVKPSKVNLTAEAAFSNFTVKQLSGKFDLDADILWNNTDISSVLLDANTFSTSLFFSARSPKNVTFNKVKKSVQFTRVVKKATSTTGDTGKVSKSAIIITGNYSLDKTLFYWPGNLTITLPLSPASPASNLFQSSSVPEIFVTNTVVEENEVGKTKVAVSIVGGSIIEDFSDGSQKTIWNGELPLSIPVVDPTGAPLPTKWTALIEITETTPSIKGTFAIPNFIHGLGFNVSWTTGKFDFLTNSVLDNSLGNILQPGFKYSSRMFLSVVKPKVADYDSFSWNDIGTESNQVEKFVIGNFDTVDSAMPLTVIIPGVYSVDKTSFSWSGQAIISIKNITVFAEIAKKQMNMLDDYTSDGPNLIKTRFGGTVLNGYVSIKSGFFGFQKTVWSGSLPLTIPVKYMSGNFSAFLFSLGIHWSGDILGNTIQGKFSIPQFSGDWFPNPSIQWIDGSFSFDVKAIWNTTLQDLFLPGASYFSKISFGGIKTTDDDLYIENKLLFPPIEPLDSELFAPIILEGTYSPDKTVFYWSGSFIISFRSGLTGKLTFKKVLKSGYESLSVTRDLETSSSYSQIGTMGTKSKQFGAKVNSGSVGLNVNNETSASVWSGTVPLNIPVSLIQNVGFSNYCIPWSGSLTESMFKGSFSFPNITQNGTDIDIVWFDGYFNFDVFPLWFTSLDGLIPNEKYCSNIIFQGASAPVNKTKLPKIPLNIGSSLQANIILKGNYSIDGSMFLWDGQVLISLKNATFVISKLTSSLKIDEVVTSKPPKPTKAPKPPKPIKKGVSLIVTGGSIFAGPEGENLTELWNGVIPVTMKLDNVVQEDSFTPMAQISWSGTPSSADIVGQFSLPVNFVNETSTISQSWVGNFSIIYKIKWSGDLETMIDRKTTYNCRLLFSDFSKKATILNSIESKLQSLGDKPDACNVIVVGTYYKKPFYCSILPFMCTDETIFTWNGEAIISFIYPPAVVIPTQATPNLKAIESANGTQHKILGKVVSGMLNGGLSGYTKQVLWSGSIPATIPLPVFWDAGTDDSSTDDKVYGHGAIWSASVFGTTLQGTFSLPQYTGKGVKSSIRWWNGDFSVQIMSLWDTGLGDIIVPGMKFYSRVIFRDIKDTTTLLQSIPPTQDEVNSAYKAPLILLGYYSVDKTTFYWTGKFIINFYNVPDTILYSL